MHFGLSIALCPVDFWDEGNFDANVNSMEVMFWNFGLVNRVRIPRLLVFCRGALEIYYGNCSQASAARDVMQGRFYNGDLVYILSL
jgi:hypothetical protein